MTVISFFTSCSKIVILDQTKSNEKDLLLRFWRSNSYTIYIRLVFYLLIYLFIYFIYLFVYIYANNYFNKK